MDLRQAVYELTAQHQLDDESARRLHAVADLGAQPRELERSMIRGLSLLAAFLLGAGIIFWIAANWNAFSRAGRFSLLQGFFIAMCLGAARLPQARAALATTAFMVMGGTFAYFGQTYQTGADPWQLFAAWSLLSLPLCFAVRSDSLWTAWCWVVMTAITLWVTAMNGGRWSVNDSETLVHLGGWLLALATCAFLSPLCSRLNGAGTWSFRSAIALAGIMITLGALVDLFDHGAAVLFPLGLVLAALAAGLFIQPRYFDVFGLSVAGLSIDTILIGVLAKTLVQGNDVGGLLILGLAAAGILAGTVHLIVSASRKVSQDGGAQ